jgi:hypothetical protein
METHGPMEIIGLKHQLEQMAECDFFSDYARAVCSQAGSLLFAFRQAVFEGGGFEGGSDSDIVSRLKDLLVKQGEG